MCSWLDLVKLLQVQYQKKLCVICFDTPALVLDTGDILGSSWGELAREVQVKQDVLEMVLPSDIIGDLI